jgi:hypothetical protein
MAEVLYGGGLRVMEFCRPRVKDHANQRRGIPRTLHLSGSHKSLFMSTSVFSLGFD